APRSEVESTIQFWNVATGQYSHRIRIEGGTVAGFDISADGKSLLVATAFQQLMNGNWQAHNELVVYDLVSGVKQQVISKNDTRGAIYGAPRYLPGGGFYAGGVLLDEQGNERLNLEINAAILSHHVTVSPDGKTLVTHEFGYLEGFTATYFKRLIDIKTGETLRKFGGSTGIAVYSPDSTRIYTTGGNGELETYDATSGELLATSYAFEDGQWATVTPDGYYTASNGASSYLNIRFAGETLPIDNFFETYYRPAVVSAAMGTRVTDDAEDSGLATANIREDFKLPPQVKFTSPANTSQSSKPSVTLTAEIVDRGGGIDEIRLYHNGKLIEGGSRGITITSDNTNDNQSLTRTFQVNLLPGENAFRLTAFSTGQRIESKSANLLINYDGRQATSDLFVLAVGVNEYKNASLNLNYGRPDAEAFVDTIRNRSQGIFNNIKVTAIYDQDATRSNMMAAFDAIAAQAGPEDAFLFFYAGHGVMSEPEDGKRADFYMALSEVVRLYGDNPGLEVGGISATEMTELTRNIQARKQMIVLDACQSGGAVQMFAMRGAAEQKAILQLARSAGLVVLASTGTEQYATEFASLGHGVFTYALLQGLAGSADGGRKDGKITVKELEAFINDEVPYLTEKHRGQAQYPNSYARGQDFPLGVINQGRGPGQLPSALVAISTTASD
ncbi:MAG: caspase family protein, partial [Pseudomonadales bacterium]